MKALVWDGDNNDLGANYDATRSRPTCVDRADDYRHELVDVVANHDELILEKYLERRRPHHRRPRRGCATPRIAGKIVPVLCGTAFKNKGVQPLLDAVVDFLPSPADLPPVTGETPGGEALVRQPEDSEPFSGWPFKIVADPFGQLSYFRVYSGTLDKGGLRPQRHQAARTGWAASSRCTPTPGGRTQSTPATSSPSSA